MAKKEIKVKTLKWKKERIKYTIVNMLEQSVVDQLNAGNVESIMELTKRVIKKGKMLGALTKYRLAQGYNNCVKTFRKGKKMGTFMLSFAAFPSLVLAGFALQKGVVKSDNKMVAGAKLAFPAE